MRVDVLEIIAAHHTTGLIHTFPSIFRNYRVIPIALYYPTSMAPESVHLDGDTGSGILPSVAKSMNVWAINQPTKPIPKHDWPENILG